MSDEITTKVSPAQALAALRCGKILDEDNETYHAAPAVSVSKMKVFRQSPALYYGRFVAKTIPAPEPTDALLLGSAIDTYIIEGPTTFAAKYYVIPKGVGKQRVGDKEIRAALAAANPGKESIKFEDAEMIKRMNENVHAHPFAGPMLRACKPQITWRVKGELFHMQVRTDGWSEEGCALTDGLPFIGDLKSIPSLNDDEPDTIPRQLSDFWYHGQEWTYRNLVSTVCGFKDGFTPPFFFWFAEKEEPYRVQVVQLDDVAQDLAFHQVKDTLDRMKECHLRNMWPNSWLETWQTKVPSVALPNYYVRRELGDRGNIF